MFVLLVAAQLILETLQIRPFILAVAFCMVPIVRSIVDCHRVVIVLVIAAIVVVVVADVGVHGRRIVRSVAAAISQFMIMLAIFMLHLTL